MNETTTVRVVGNHTVYGIAPGDTGEIPTSRLAALVAGGHVKSARTSAKQQGASTTDRPEAEEEE